MIGPCYWATGIHLDHAGHDAWTAGIKFLDDGFCQSASTEGELHLRYMIPHKELDAMIDVLIADAERLGIEWNTPNSTPMVYIPQDGEDESRDDNEKMLQEAVRQSERLGWDTLYKRRAATDAAG